MEGFSLQSSGEQQARDVQGPLLCAFLQLSPRVGGRLPTVTVHSAEVTQCPAVLEKLSWIFLHAEIHRGLGVVEAIFRQPPHKAPLTQNIDELFCLFRG